MSPSRCAVPLKAILGRKHGSDSNGEIAAAALACWQHHTAIGAVSGVVEVCMLQPTVAIKNALQEGRPIPRSPIALYRGLIVNAASIAPITATQFGANRVLERLVQRMHPVRDLTQLERVAVAAGAGATSALVSCPAELVMIQQQTSGRSLLEQARHLLATSGVRQLYRGFSMTLARETLYTAGYLGLCPVLREWLAEQSWMVGYPPQVPFLTAGIAAGLLAALATQPVDTAKTRLQAFLDANAKPEYGTARSTLQHIVETQGWTGLWAGIAPRAVRIVGATVIMNATRNTLIGVLEERQAEADVVDAAVTAHE